MTRIPYHDMSGLPEELASTVNRRQPLLNIYRMLVHAPTIAPGFLEMGRGILANSELDPQLRELVILRVGAFSKAQYEIFQHKRVARSVGVADEKIDAVLSQAARQSLSEFEQLVIRFTDSVVNNVKAPDDLFEQVLSQLSPRLMSELLLTIGFYMMVCRFLENTGVEIEENSA